MNIKKYEKAYTQAQAGGMSNDAAHEFATDQATRKTKAEAAPAPVGSTIQGIDYKTALLEIGRMAQARKSCIRMPNGMMLDNYVGQVLAYVPAPIPSAEAAPALLEALKWIAERLERGGKAANSDAAQQARAAIAMAGGAL